MVKSKAELSSKEEISIDRIRSDLESIGLRKGDHIGLGISFKKLGYVKGGPETFVDTLLKVVGSEGTVIIPTYTRYPFRLRIKPGKFNYIFDYRTTPAYTGIIPETIRKRKDSIRSKHPSNSIAAIGALAKYFTECHGVNSSSYLPYSKLSEVDGKILCIGIGKNLVGIRHEAQYLAGLLHILPSKQVIKYRDDYGKINLFVRRDRGGCVKKLPDLVSILKEKGLVKKYKIGLADSILLPAKESLKIMTNILKTNPCSNLCDDVLCLWCREVERRLKLYKDIETPQYFQKNHLIIKLITIINQFRLLTYKRGITHA